MPDDKMFRYAISRDRIMTDSPSKQTLWVEAQEAAEKYASENGLGLSSATCEWIEDEGLLFKYRLVELPFSHQYSTVTHGPDIPEVLPIPNTYPAVWGIVIEDAERFLFENETKKLVLEDMKKRDEFGFKKYKTRLHPFDGRDTLWDMYQELLDLVVYTRKEIYEKETDDMWVLYRDLLGLVARIRKKIYEKEMEKTIEGAK